jgi:hypothetical protein
MSVTFWVNVYTNPTVQHDFEGREHPSKEMADEAAEHEMANEPQTKLLRQEERMRAKE